MNRLSSSSNESEEASEQHGEFYTFEQFVLALGDKLSTTIEFEQSNKLLRFKRCEYMTNQEVLEYFRSVFGKKTNSSMRRKWHIKDKFTLFWVLTKYCQLKQIHQYRMGINDWEHIAHILKLCKRFIMRKWICLLRHTTCHFHWTHEEEEILVKYMAIKEYNSKWSELSLMIFEEAGSSILRTCKDVRERWKNYLDPTLKKTHWNQQEDNKLIELIKDGGKKWSSISKQIAGRTQNQVKNRFITLYKRNKFLFEHEEVYLKLQNEEEIKEEHQHQHQEIMSHDHHDTHYDSMEDQEDFIRQVLRNDYIQDLMDIKFN